MKPVNLTARLKVLTELIEDGTSVVDIGTDHGYLPVYLAQTGSSCRIIASDISAASLEAARKTADKYNVTDSITFRVAQGLDGIDPDDVDTVVIAGMGGETIKSIIEEAPWTKSQNKTLILQPQSKIDVLFRFLYDNNYEINKIRYVQDRGKFFTVICIKRKESVYYGECK